MPNKKPKIYVVHLGCAKNQVDAENLVGEMLHAGFVTCDTAAKADYILVNTCGLKKNGGLTKRLPERSVDQLVLLFRKVEYGVDALA